MATRLSDIPDKPQNKPIRLSDIPEVPDFIRDRRIPQRPIADPSGFEREDTELSFARGISERINPTARVGQTLGGLAGGIGTSLLLGRAIPGWIDDAAIILGSMAGSGAGAATGETVQRAISPLEDVSLKAAGQAALVEAGSDLIGGLASKAFAAIFRKMASKSAFEALARRLMPSGDPTRAGKELYAQAGKKVSYPTSAGIVYKRGFIHSQVSDFYKPIFEKRNKLVGSGGVSTDRIKSIAKRELAKQTGLKSRIRTPAETEMLRSLLKENKVITFEQMDSLKRLYQEAVERQDYSKKLWNDLAREARESLTDAGSYRGIHPKNVKMVREINEAYTNTMDMMGRAFPEAFVEGLRTDPQKVIGMFGTPGSTGGMRLENIRAVKKMLIEPVGGIPNPSGMAAWDEVRQAYWSDLIRKNTTATGFNTKAFERTINMMTNEVRGEIFKPDELGRLKQLTRLLSAKNAQILPYASGLVPAGLIGYDIYHDLTNRDNFVAAAKGGGILLSAGIISAAARKPAMARLAASIMTSPRINNQVSIQTIRLIRLLKADEKERELQLVKTRMMSNAINKEGKPIYVRPF
jgi:hypothetical protein